MRLESRIKALPGMLVGLAMVCGVLAGCGSSPVASGNTAPDTRSTGCSATRPLRPGTYTATIASDGLSRVYQLDVPHGYDGRHPFGMVLALHPLSVSYTYMPSLLRFSTTTGRYRFIGVAPSGLLDHGTPYWYAAPTPRNHDVDFISALIAHLEATMCIDPARVLATGISNGAQLSSLLGCRLAGRVTSIAPVEGEEYLTPCTGEPEPIVAFHGTADPILPYAGGGLNATTIADIDYWKGRVPPGLPKPMGVDASMRSWARHNGCVGGPVDTKVTPHVVERHWLGCRAPTTLYVVEGGGHGWPGQPVPAEESTFGPDTTEVDATDIILAAFGRTA